MSKDSQRRRGGDKRSSWLTFRRRMFVFRRLLQKPTSSRDLIYETKTFFTTENIYGEDPESALRHDIHSLREDFHCDIGRDRQKRYVMKDVGELALFDPSATDMEVMRFLIETHTDNTTPSGVAIDPFLQRMLQLFPQAQREQIQLRAHEKELGSPDHD